MEFDHYFLNVMSAGEADDVTAPSTANDETAKQTGSSNDDVILTVDDQDDDEVVASRDHARVSMATADSTSSESYPLSATVELPPRRPDVTSS